MTGAIDAVKGVSCAANDFGIPRQTIRDGRVVHGTNPGPRLFLTRVQEKKLWSFLVDVAKAVYKNSGK